MGDPSGILDNRTDPLGTLTRRSTDERTPRGWSAVVSWKEGSARGEPTPVALSLLVLW
jgi:hypothetical protein